MTAIVVLGPSGLATAKRLVASLPEARLHGLAGRLDDDAGIAVSFTETVGHIRTLFDAGETVIGICAAAILIRAVAPSLKEKSIEPPVIAVADDGSVAVPLLGGHRGGNDLARRIATVLGGTAAATTAGDLRLGLSLDEPPPGWRIANPAAIKTLAAALQAMLRGFDRVFSTPFPYCSGWHDAPRSVTTDWQLHAHYYPPLLRSADVAKIPASYELLANVQRDVTPEAAAGRLRDLL